MKTKYYRGRLHNKWKQDIVRTADTLNENQRKLECYGEDLYTSVGGYWFLVIMARRRAFKQVGGNKHAKWITIIGKCDKRRFQNVSERTTLDIQGIKFFGAKYIIQIRMRCKSLELTNLE